MPQGQKHGLPAGYVDYCQGCRRLSGRLRKGYCGNCYYHMRRYGKLPPPAILRPEFRSQADSNEVARRIEIYRGRAERHEELFQEFAAERRGHHY